MADGSRTDLIVSVLVTIREADTVPLADPIHCGRADLHNLAGANDIAAYLLHQLSHLTILGPNARELTDDDQP